ncbi:bromodomain adjacent to zinc finger domain protein 2B-like isoform X4 [Mytilus californianus]|uniref:bromodomain adjacent to zinc finger domain protein 2B-like isoform X4 n=1 Tax=Mytilus californianus TaxID=6549 RepID=UPI0022479544|nr:bromodomain adjacent to zinc finger domain protein 2B-like isoform X4 [Mytilus californianus]
MDKSEKDDPGSPTRNNLFENAAANLLGVSPFGLPYAAHLAHIPGAFLMGHPAFPVTSLFDGLMGHYPSSLVTSSASAYHSLYSSASMRSPQQKSSPKTVSQKNTITKATTTIATTTTSSCSNSISKKTVTTPVVAGTTGVSLLSGKVKKSPGRPPKTDSSTKTNGSSVLSSHSSSRTSTVSQPVKSVLNLSTHKQKENGVLENDCQSDISSCSSYLSDDGSNAKGEEKSKNAGSTIHIDGLKKKLIADQIRQRVQSKPTQSTTPSILQPMKRGRGRPPKSASKEGIALEEIQEYKKQQEELKKQFEANLKEQQIQLKMFKKAQELKDMETSAKINQLLEAHANLGKPLPSEQAESQSSSGTFKPKSKSLQASIDKLKAASKLPSSDNNSASQTVKPRLSSPTGRLTMTSPSHKQQTISSQKTKSGSQSHNHISKLESSTRKRVDSPTNLSLNIGSPSHKHGDPAVSPPVPSPTERSKLFAETLFNKIRTEVEQDNKSDENVFTRIRTESEQNTTCDEDDSSDSEGSQAAEYDSEDRNEESDTSNLAMKRSADEMSEDYDGSSSTSKRPRVQTDERELKVPLERGWKRSTTILAIGKRGFIGEVLYFAPCGKKMKTIPDVMRYIDKHVITNLGRENFSFCTRVNVGDFYEQRGEENEIVKLTQGEIVQRMTLIESKRQKLRKLKEQRGKKKSEKQNKQILLAKQMMEQKFKKKVEQQDMARKAAEYKLQKTSEKQRLKDMAHRIKHVKALEKRKQQEQLRLLKEQEKLQRHEQMRMERELRAQQILEDREMKRQQALLMKEQVNTDRERRRQHILLVKALEAQKKQAEKDRIKESRMAEKKISRERKMEQRRQELQLLRELRRPVDDMQLKEARVLPEYPRIKGIELDGNAFADILMVLEFLHNFSDALGFVESDTLPTLRTLQEAVIGRNEEDMEDYIALTSHLTRYAVMDPGVPNPKEAVTKLGQKIIDVDISDGVVSEVLCIFITARNGKPNEMSDWLQEKPLESLHQNQRASILAFLCNELLCGKSISCEIEKNLDHMGDIRRDKWVIEGQLRRLRVKQGKKFRSPTKPVREDDSSVHTKDGDDSILTCQDGDESTCLSVSKRGSDEEEEKDDESGNEYDENQSVKDNEGEMEEDENLSLEECEKKIEKLQKQHAQHRAKVFKASHRVRAITLGQDRYKRRYWVLPKAGGVYVEGLESGNFEEKIMIKDCEIKSESTSMTVEQTKENFKDIKEENESSSSKKLKSSENSNLGSLEVSDNVNIKLESSDFSGKKDNDAEKTMSDAEMKSCNGEISTSAENSAISLQTESKNIFLQSPTSNKLSDLCNLSTVKSERSEDSNLTIPHAHSSPLITPYSPSPFNMFFNSFSNQTTESNSSPLPAHQHPKSSTPSTDSKSSFLSIDTLLKKENEPVKTSSASSIFSTFPLAQDQITMTSNDDQKPWFSILPRMPCEDLSVAQVTSQLGMHGPYNSLPFFSPLTVSAFPIQSPTFSSFQIGQLTNSNQDEGEIKQNMKISETNNSFKIPSTPKMEPNTSSFYDPGEINTYDEPQPIEKEMTEGWWRVVDQNQVRELMRCCHPRGIREKNLQKTLQKFQEYACESCSKGDKHVVSLEASDSSDSDEENKQTNEDKKEDDNEDEKQGKKKKKKRKESEESVIDHAHQVELTVLDAVENLEERVASASLQVKGWKVPQRISDESDIKLVDRFHVNLKENEKYPLDVAREKLINLEPNIERRYLKPPLCKNQQINLANISASSFNDGHDSSHCDENGDEDNYHEEQPSTPAPVPSGLLTWRNAVALSKSPAQLTLCVYQLNNAISWEKSIMKVLCQICRKDDNEAELLLCDGCDKGYHTYCFKPKMENIPEGDWYCYACISKATGEPCCIVCGRKHGKIIECDHCPRAIHIDCLDPPLPRMPRKYACPSCIANQGMKKKQKRSPKKRRESFVRRERKDSETSTKTVEIPVEKKRGKNVEKIRTAEQSENMTACRLVLTEMEKHEDGWPFLKPVNFKQFPTYKKYIKNPMDFTTMKNKLRDSLYKTRGEFASDTRLVFNNCMIFNEDESDVGKAGHTMRKFFEQRWKDLLLSSDSTEQPSVGEDENS